jgi:pyridoxal phosphate enzyme (YggS family)
MATTEVATQLAQLQSQIRTEAEQNGRSADRVELVAVSKTRSVAEIQAVMDAGHQLFGENKVQELADKQPALPQARWHLVGPLQRNKVKYIVDFVELIHTLDNVKLLREIEKRAAKAGRTIDCLVQINISGEAQKSGTDREGLYELLEAVASCQHVRIRGLMGIAELTDNRERIRQQFAGLRALFEEASATQRSGWLPNHLSMGMSGDYDLAIAEGATLIRIGSALFGPRG